MDATPGSPTNDLEYTKSDGEVTIIKLKNTKMKEVVIPSTIDGLPVTSIENETFTGCCGLTSVPLPASVTSIGKNAFGDCYNLTIRGPRSSIAEKYAKKKGIKFETTTSSSR